MALNLVERKNYPSFDCCLRFLNLNSNSNVRACFVADLLICLECTFVICAVNIKNTLLSNQYIYINKMEVSICDFDISIF